MTKSQIKLRSSVQTKKITGNQAKGANGKPASSSTRSKAGKKASAPASSRSAAAATIGKKVTAAVGKKKKKISAAASAKKKPRKIVVVDESSDEEQEVPAVPVISSTKKSSSKAKTPTTTALRASSRSASSTASSALAPSSARRETRAARASSVVRKDTIAKVKPAKKKKSAPPSSEEKESAESLSDEVQPEDFDVTLCDTMLGTTSVKEKVHSDASRPKKTVVFEDEVEAMEKDLCCQDEEKKAVQFDQQGDVTLEAEADVSMDVDVSVSLEIPDDQEDHAQDMASDAPYIPAISLDVLGAPSQSVYDESAEPAQSQEGPDDEQLDSTLLSIQAQPDHQEPGDHIAAAGPVDDDFDADMQAGPSEEAMDQSQESAMVSKYLNLPDDGSLESSQKKISSAPLPSLTGVGESQPKEHLS